ncbi:MAG TPA: ATP-binding protein [Anaerolineae bacterium]|nr:ATP-binding protein [Anaerolineae bacterium]
MARLVGYFLFLSLLTAGLVGYAVYVQATDDLEQSVIDRLAAVASLKEDALTRWVNDQSRNLVFVAWMPNIQAQAGRALDESQSSRARQGSREVLAGNLTSIVSSMSDAEALFIMDLEGRIVVSTDRSLVGYSQDEAALFLQGRSNTYVQPFHPSPFSSKPMMAVATPLFNNSRRRIGVLAAYLSSERVERIIQERSGLGQTGESYLVDSSGTAVTAPTSRTQEFAGGQAISSEGIDAALGGQDGASLYRNYRDVPVVGVYRWLGDREVALMAEMSRGEAFAPATRMARAILVMGAITAAVLGLGLYFLARQIARPILAIAQTASKVAAGDLSQSTPVMTDDEVGVLARAFNQMTAQLRVFYQELESRVTERTRDLADANSRLRSEMGERLRVEETLRHQNEYLAALHETALGLMGRLELQELFQDLVTRAGQLLGTGHGFVFIADMDGDEIECKVGIGAFEAMVGLRVGRGEGLSGRVWESGQSITIDDYDAWHGRLPAFPADTLRAGAGVPLTSGSETVGVLGLAYNGGSTRTFGESEVEILTRFAALVSIAIDNARLFAMSQEARALAEAANVAKSQFLASVSHELRTPLTSILGFTRLVKKRIEERIAPLIPPGEAKTDRTLKQVEDNLSIILLEGQRLTTLINDLLDLEKIEAGKVEWHMEPLQIADVVDQAADGTAALFEEKKLALIRAVPRDLAVCGDRDRLVQVLVNLFSNAVKFTPEGTITVRAWQEPGQVVVSVQDPGIGISAADQEHLFEKFIQVGDTLLGKPRGTGLGLAISREIVTHHGGRIWVDSEPGAGSTFSFALPARKEPETDGKSAQTAPS